MSSNCSLEVRKDGSQVVDYTYKDYFVYMCERDIFDQNGTSSDAHWHEDIELIAVLSGCMMYNINGSLERIKAGEGLIINSRQMHYSYPSHGAPCQYLCLLLHPMLLCVSPKTEVELVKPLLEDKALPYVLLDGDDPWKQEVVGCIKEIYDSRDKSSAALRIQSLFCRIWVHVFEHAEHCRKDLQRDNAEEKTLTTLKAILSYIHEHYRDRITLEDLARAGFVSKSHCMTLFRQHLHDSPIKYLIKYRLKLSEDLLANSTATITNVAYQVGFSGASFYIETFRKYYGCTPLEYRRDHWREKTRAQTDAMQIKIG